MQTKDRNRLMNMGRVPFKVATHIGGATAGAIVYYYKPSFPCRLIDITVKVIGTAPASSSGGITITKSIVDDFSAQMDKVITGVTEKSAVTNSTLMTAVTNSANSSVGGIVGANYHTANAVDSATMEALKISIAKCTTTALDAVLILEFLPV